MESLSQRRPDNKRELLVNVITSVDFEFKFAWMEYEKRTS